MSIIAVLALAFALGAASDDDEQEREDAIFGDSEDAPEELPQDVEDASDKLEERFGARLDEQQDPLAIGGVVLLRLESAVVDDAALDEQRVSTPNFLDVYFDARPTPRLRFYARGRVLADFTRGGDSQDPGLTLATTGTGNLNRSADAVDTQLDQLWMKFDLGRRLYVTFGPQRIRWGAGQFWNPTDFLNRRFRDPLAFFDERLGVGLLKLHLPLESLGSNLYAIANFDAADTLGEVGGALRAEVLIENTEISVTAVERRERPLRLGVDVSSPLGPFDIRGEVAFIYDDPGLFFRPARADEPAPLDDDAASLFSAAVAIPEALRVVPVDRRNEWQVQSSIGADIQLFYSTEDSVVLGAEYFFSSVGQQDDAIYPALFATGAFTPLYTGRHYGALFVSLPSPGSWNTTSFSTTTLANFSDGSLLSRLNVSTVLSTFARFSAFMSVSWGSVGEFRNRFQIPGLLAPDAPLDPSLLANLEQPALTAVLLRGLDINAPILNVGFQLQMSF